MLYRLGRLGASGVLTLAAPAGRPEVFVLRRGAAVCSDGDLVRRALSARLARSVAEPALVASFDGSVAAYPPGAAHQVGLAGWVRSHLEAQLDRARADQLVRELAGVRLALRPDLVPEPLDEADRRMLAALGQPRRLDEIWQLARVPRFRLLAFLHFAGAAGALAAAGQEPRRSTEPPRPPPSGNWRQSSDVAGARPARAPDPPSSIPSPRAPFDPRRRAALRLLEIDDAADADAVKRAYRRLARALHPDLQPEADDQRRRSLERRFAELTAAYEALR